MRKIAKISFRKFCTRQARDRLKYYPKRGMQFSVESYVKAYIRDNHLKADPV